MCLHTPDGSYAFSEGVCRYLVHWRILSYDNRVYRDSVRGLPTALGTQSHVKRILLNESMNDVQDVAYLVSASMISAYDDTSAKPYKRSHGAYYMRGNIPLLEMYLWVFIPWSFLSDCSIVGWKTSWSSSSRGELRITRAAG